MKLPQFYLVNVHVNYDFLQGWKSLLNTTVYILKIKIFLFSPIPRERPSVQQAEFRLTHWNFRRVSVFVVHLWKYTTMYFWAGLFKSWLMLSQG